jgi:hypothetical protein
MKDWDSISDKDVLFLTPSQPGRLCLPPGLCSVGSAFVSFSQCELSGGRKADSSPRPVHGNVLVPLF